MISIKHLNKLMLVNVFGFDVIIIPVELWLISKIEVYLNEKLYTVEKIKIKNLLFTLYQIK